MADSATNDDDDDDYMSMTFAEPAGPRSRQSETSLQRAARQKHAAAERGRPLSKAEQAARERDARDRGLATRLDPANSRGARMLAKMGFTGGALGAPGTEGARTQPIAVQVRDDGRAGIGMEAERKRKVREAAEMEEGKGGEKRVKVTEDEFRERQRSEREEKRAEGQMWGAMKVLEECETEAPVRLGEDVGVDGAEARKDAKHLRDVNVLYRPLLKQRLVRERELKMRHELNNSLSNRNDYDDDDEDDKLASFDARADQLNDEDEELEGFENLAPAERRDRIVGELRDKYFYCFWCKHRYEDASLDGCPGVTEDEHG